MTKGVIHDLGYARYSGERRPPSTLWRVIMRQHLAYAWKTRWRLKPWILGALMITVGVGVVLWVSKNAIIGMMSARGVGPTWLSGAIPFAYQFYRIPAFMISMTIGAAIIARDREIGAFTFYFSRPVRPLDYVLGKLGGQLLLMSLIFLAGPVVLSLYSVGLTENTSDALQQLKILPKALVIGVLGTLAYATVPLAFSALAPRRTVALAMWAGYYIMASTIIAQVGSLVWLPLKAFDLASAMESLAMKLFDVKMPGDELAPLWASAGSLILQSGIAIAILVKMVQREAEGSVGGSS
ncbi:MAG TPA: ABC transporter permease subunit [Kofleriaceae bacterium]|nr:ABC transporter permease subunit [Kofleriaceae bacterium]